jgi:hypothetical protein
VTPPLRSALVGAALALLATACGPRYVRVETFDEPGLRVVLRSETSGGKTVPRGFSHPVTISSVRLAHILARLDVRLGSDDGGERIPAFPTVTLYAVGEQLSKALSRATPDQEVAVQAVRKEKQLAIFDKQLLTSFVAYVKGDELVIQLSRVEWEVPKGGESTGDDEIPEPFAGRQVQEFKVLPADGLVVLAAQAVSVDWRNPVFRDPTNVRVGSGGKLLRKSVLMETAPGAPVQEAEPAVRPEDLPPETLRALADLQEQRTRGEISETTYHQKRRDLLRQADDVRRAEEVAPAPAPAAP